MNIFVTNFVKFQFKEADQSQLMDSKLRCVFELPMDATQAPQNNIDAAPASQPQVEVPKPSPKVNCKVVQPF